MTDQTPREQLAEIIRAGWHPDARNGQDRETADAIVAVGWRPPARVVTDPAELDALPIGSVILLEYGVVAQAVGGEEDINATGWMGVGHDLQWTTAQVVEHAGEGASFTVLYVPVNGDTQ